MVCVRGQALQAVTLGRAWTLLACTVPYIVLMFFGRHTWEQEKLEARKMLENGDESHLSSARFGGRRLLPYLIKPPANHDMPYHQEQPSGGYEDDS
jgi:hypothetical protein